jgi:hypothetical protein
VTCKWREITAAAAAAAWPVARAGAAMACAGRWLVVHGGETAAGLSAELWLFDTGTPPLTGPWIESGVDRLRTARREWQLVPPSAAAPAGRCGALLVARGATAVLVGGRDAADGVLGDAHRVCLPLCVSVM